MFLANYVKHPDLSTRIKEIAAGHYLFRQGEMGNTMCVILDGMIQLFDQGDEEQHLIGTFGPGQFFGEKALLKNQPYLRMYSAQAQVKTLVLEFDLRDVPIVESVVPGFMTTMFQSAAQRLDRTYYLIRILKSNDDMERLVHCILYFYRTPGLESTAGKYTPLTVEDIHYLTNMNKEMIRVCLDDLAQRQILVKRPNDCYMLRDEQGLMAALMDRKVAA